MAVHENATHDQNWAEIERVLDKARPALALHDGGIQLLDLTAEGIVSLSWRGSCVGCSLSDMTLRLGLERLLLEELPHIVKGVSAA